MSSLRPRAWFLLTSAVAATVALAGCGDHPAVPAVPPRASVSATGAAMSVYPALRSSGPPRFIVAATGPVAVYDPPTAKNPTSYTPSRAVVLDAETGRVLHTIASPAGIFSSWPAVAAAPDDRTFVIGGLTAPGGGFAFYTVRLDSQGRPGPSRRIATPLPAAGPDGGLVCALSPDGRRLAYSSMATGGVTVVDIVTSARRVWTGLGGRPVHGLQWAADGRRLWVSMIGPGSTLRVLDTTLPASDLARTVRAGAPTIGDGAVVTPDEHTVVYFDGSHLVRRPFNGGSAQTLARIQRGGGAGGLTIDGSGRHALYAENWRIHRVDLATGRTASFPVPTGQRQGKGDNPGIAW